MRYLKLFLFVALLPLLVGSGTKEKTFTKGIKQGSLAPKINLQGVDFTNEKYVLVQFWAVYDGESRKQNALLNNKISHSGLENLEVISISFDEKKSVFEQAVKADRLNVLNQFNDEKGRLSEIYKSYHLQNGFGNLLIDPNGIIVACNVSSEQVIKLFKKKSV